MSVEELYAKATSLIDTHNSNFPSVGDNPTTGPASHPPGYVSTHKFIQHLKLLGGTTDNRLKGMSHEDILECMEVTGPIQPRLLAKDIAKIFRDKEEPSLNAIFTASPRLVERMTITELITQFNANSTAIRTRTCYIAKRLDEISKGQPFLVYPDDSGKPDVQVSTALLEDLCNGLSPMTEVPYKDGIQKVYKVYDQYTQYLPENPLYPRRGLRAGETCDQTLRSWSGVERRVRQLICIAVTSGELVINLDRAHNIIDVAISSDAWTSLVRRYPKAAVKFASLERAGSLPSLLLDSTQTTGNQLAEGKKVASWHQVNSMLNPERKDHNG